MAAVKQTRGGLFRESTAVIPFKQVRPGDALEPVQEWTKQFEGTFRISAEVVEFFIDNTDFFSVPHGLGRPIIGAVLMGIFNDLEVPGVDAVSYAVNIESSTDEFFDVQVSANISGTSRWLIF